MVMAFQLDIVFVNEQEQRAVVVDVANPSETNIRKKDHKVMVSVLPVKTETLDAVTLKRGNGH